MTDVEGRLLVTMYPTPKTFDKGASYFTRELYLRTLRLRPRVLFKDASLSSGNFV